MTRRCVSCAEERNISDLQAEIDRLNRLIRERSAADSASGPLPEAAAHSDGKAVDSGDDKPAALDQRLSQLSQRGEAILDHWAETDRRYAHAVREMESRLGEWQLIEGRLRQESLERMRAFEQAMAREWRELRDVHEEPLRQLREQASALGETSVAAANLALRGYERAEARLASLETDLRGQLGQLSREVHAALAEIRQERALGPRPAAAPFQLDTVMKLHSELRDTSPAVASEPRDMAEIALVAAKRVTTVDAPAVEPAPPEPARVLEPALTAAGAAAAARETFTALKSNAPVSAGPAVRIVYPRKSWRIVPAAIALAVIVAGVIGAIQLQQGAAIGGSSAQAAASAPPATIPAPGDGAAGSGERADASNGAALAAGVITSPDVIRFAMTGIGAGRGASGQVLWSRSKGVVVTASGVPAPEAGSVYRFWLLSDTQAVPVSQVVPDAGGRVRFAVPNPSQLPNLIDSVAVTVEANGPVAARPSSSTILRRAYP